MRTMYFSLLRCQMCVQQLNPENLLHYTYICNVSFDDTLLWNGFSFILHFEIVPLFWAFLVQDLFIVKFPYFDRDFVIILVTLETFISSHTKKISSYLTMPSSASISSSVEPSSSSVSRQSFSAAFNFFSASANWERATNWQAALYVSS